MILEFTNQPTLYVLSRLAAQPFKDAVDTVGLRHTQHMAENHIVDLISLHKGLQIHCPIMAEVQRIDLVVILS